jgi:hypothetical protein
MYKSGANKAAIDEINGLCRIVELTTNFLEQSVTSAYTGRIFPASA